MYFIYTYFKLLLAPEVWIFIVLIVGCHPAWKRYWHRSARLTLLLLLALYFTFTTRPFTQALIEPLETYYRPPTSIPMGQDAIVIFASAPRLQPYTERPTIVGTRNADLLLCGLVYVHAGSASNVVLIGEASGEGGPISADAKALQEWAVLLGYPRETIVIGAQTDATHDRAHAAKQLLGNDKKILLLDSAMHLPRSTAAFTKAGFSVTPIPCDYEMSTAPWDLSDFIPQGRNLKSTNAAIHEYGGLLTYWLRGFI